jgi:RNA polymerase sigma factor (sigma-70 family)
MACRPSDHALASVEVLYRVGTLSGLTDGDLLARFIAGPEPASEAAFAALVDRHGPMVFQVCRRVLGDASDADDAAQATFLVLARRARAIRRSESVASWLFGVALRVAHRARDAAARRRAHERRRAEMATWVTSEDSGGSEADWTALYEELDRLPESLRGPLVLCYLEGMTHEQAAGRLRVAERTLRRHLERGRERLRARLTRRGLAPALGLLGVGPTGAAGRAAEPPAAWAAKTVRAAVEIASGRAATAGASAAALTLAEEALRAMIHAKLRMASLALATAGLSGLGLIALAQVPERVRVPVPSPSVAAAVAPSPPISDLAKASRPKGLRPGEAREVAGVLSDPEGRPLARADVVVRIEPSAASGKERPPARFEVLKSGPDGRFSCPIPAGWVKVFLAARARGHAVAIWESGVSDEMRPSELKLKAARQTPFDAILVDGEGRPIAGAELRVERFETAPVVVEEGAGQRTVAVCYQNVPEAGLPGTPLEGLFSARTDPAGRFTFLALPPEGGMRLAVRDRGGRLWRVLTEDVAGSPELIYQGFVPLAGQGIRRLTAAPAARIVGRVTTRLPDVSVGGLTVDLQSTRQPKPTSPGPHRDQGARTVTEADGRFRIEGLEPGTVNVCLGAHPGETPWTYRAAQDVELRLGETTEVGIELIEGVRVSGRVVDGKTGRPIAGARVAHYGPIRPRSGAATFSVETDDEGVYHLRLPPGESYFYMFGMPEGYVRSPSAGQPSRTVEIPAGAQEFGVPPIELVPGVALSGRLLDVRGRPVPGATIVGVCAGAQCAFPTGITPAGTTDAEGRFRLAGQNHLVVPDEASTMQIRLADGRPFDVPVVAAADGAVTAVLPPEAGPDEPAPEGADPPRDVAPDELAGVVIDEEGRPLASVLVDAWTWYPGNEATTGADGRFRIKGLSKDQGIEVQFTKEGYTPRLFVAQPTGQPGRVVRMDDDTYFEGKVTGPDGRPVAGALVRGNRGPKRNPGVVIATIWTETRTGADGRYRLYAEADAYDIQVRVPGVGVARRPGTSIAPDEARSLDLPLEAGEVFVAKVVDSLTGEPVAGFTLGCFPFDHPDIEGRSGEDGILRITDMLPGRFDFRRIDAPGYARWWSDATVSPFGRPQVIERLGGWQRNFDGLDFDLRSGMEPVTIVAEKGVTVRGRVVDPEGRPVAGATVAPALTGTGNSLTGDTRFSVTTDDQGRFEVLLPAGNGREYNLVAHDGKLHEWRTWANGVTEPLLTTPGQEIDGIEIALIRPVTVRGRVVDSQGRPVADREVRSHADDRRENRYYDPTTQTDDDGRFELKYVRPGRQYVQVAPFWLDAAQAPGGTSRVVEAKPGEVIEDVALVAQPESR